MSGSTHIDCIITREIQQGKNTVGGSGNGTVNYYLIDVHNRDYPKQTRYYWGRHFAPLHCTAARRLLKEGKRYHWTTIKWQKCQTEETSCSLKLFKGVSSKQTKGQITITISMTMTVTMTMTIAIAIINNNVTIIIITIIVSLCYLSCKTAILILLVSIIIIIAIVIIILVIMTTIMIII